MTWSDVERVREANGYDDVPDLDDEDARSDYTSTMIGGSDDSVVMVSLGGFDRELAVDPDEVGVDWRTAEAVASSIDQGREVAWYGAADDVEPSDAVTDEGDGLFATDGGPFVAVDGAEAVLSTEEDLARAWLDDDGDTLADDDDVSEVARALDDADAVSGLITSLGAGGSASLVGLGWVDDDGDPACVFVYSLGSGRAARDAVDGLEADFAELDDQLRVDDVEADGSLVVVSAHQVDRVSAPADLFQRATLPVPD